MVFTCGFVQCALILIFFRIQPKTVIV